MTTLTHEFVQHRKDDTSRRESDITITVEYNPETDELDEVKVECYNYFKGVFTDVTEIFETHFDLDKILADIDWAEKYADGKKEKITLENEE